MFTTTLSLCPENLVSSRLRRPVLDHVSLPLLQTKGPYTRLVVVSRKGHSTTESEGVSGLHHISLSADIVGVVKTSSTSVLRENVKCVSITTCGVHGV